MGALNDFSSPVAEQRESQLAAVRDAIRMTADLGAGVLRVFLAWAGSTPVEGGGARYDLAQKAWDAAHEDFPEEQVWAWCRQGLVEAARWAGEAGVTLALQNHRPVVRSYHQVLQMVREVGSPHLKVCLDAPLMEKKDAAYLRQAALDAGPLQVQTHYFGEFERPVAGEKVRLVDKRGGWRAPFERHGYVEENFYVPFVQALLETGYRGFIAYEPLQPSAGRGRPDGGPRLRRRVRAARPRVHAGDDRRGPARPRRFLAGARPRRLTPARCGRVAGPVGARGAARACLREPPGVGSGENRGGGGMLTGRGRRAGDNQGLSRSRTWPTPRWSWPPSPSWTGSSPPSSSASAPGPRRQRCWPRSRIRRARAGGGCSPP